MRTVLESLHGVPGVIGALLIEDGGAVTAHSLPSIYDAETLKEISSTLAENIDGLQDFTGGVISLDMRFENGRLVVKKLSRHSLILLCQQTLNIQLLLISLNVVINKLEKLVSEAPKAAPVALQPPVKEAEPTASAIRTNDKGVILKTMILDKTSNMSANSLINPNTAAAIKDYFHGLDYKILLLNNVAKSKSVKVPVHVLNSDSDGSYDGVIGITPSIAGDLSAKEGDDLLVVVSVSKGFFG